VFPDSRRAADFLIGQQEGIMGSEVRLAAKSDLAELLEIDREGFGPGAGYNALVLRQILDAAPEFFFVAASEGVLRGYCAALPGSKPRTAWLVSILVVPAGRKQRVGSNLVESVLAALRGSGAREVFLTVRPDNPGALALFQRAGFQKIGFEADYFGPGEGRLVMQARL
jgi:[ribosomal protein S18]-alanine N-acetyltransferase